MSQDLEQRARWLDDFKHTPYRIVIPDISLGKELAHLLEKEHVYDYVEVVSCFLREPKELSETIEKFVRPFQHHPSVSPKKTVAIVFTNLNSLGTKEISEIKTHFDYSGLTDYSTSLAEADKVLYLDTNLQKYKDPVLFDPNGIGILTETGLQPLFSQEDIALGYAIHLQKRLDEQHPFSLDEDVDILNDKREISLAVTLQHLRNLEESAKGLDTSFMNAYGIGYGELIEQFNTVLEQQLPKALEEIESRIERIIKGYREFKKTSHWLEMSNYHRYQNLKMVLGELRNLLKEKNHKLYSAVDELYQRIERA